MKTCKWCGVKLTEENKATETLCDECVSDGDLEEIDVD